MEEKYRALRIIATLLKVLAWIALVFGVLGAILLVVAAVLGLGAISGRIGIMEPLYGYGVARVPVLGGIVTAMLTAIGSVLYFLFLYAASEMIQLQLDIEQNTRETAYYLRPKL